MEANARNLRMQDTSVPTASVPGAPPQKADEPHVLHVRPDVPIEVSFSFEHPQSRVGISASVLSHIAMAVIAFLVMRYQPEAQSLAIVDDLPSDIVWLNEPGPGGGGGGGGNKAPEPPKKVELPGKEKITVPVEKIPEPKLAPPPEEVKPLEELNIPAKSMAAADQPLPGAITRETPVTTSQGPGREAVPEPAKAPAAVRVRVLDWVRDRAGGPAADSTARAAG